MNIVKKTPTVWYQICLALLISVCSFGCGGESSSNDSDGDDGNNNATREFDTSIGTVTVDRDPNNENTFIVNTPTVTNNRITCDGGDTTLVFGETEVDICG